MFLPVLWMPVATAQVPPLPSLPEASPAECTLRYGHLGCAAKLYAHFLCSSAEGGLNEERGMEQALADQFEQAAIRFSGISAEQVEQAAVRYYVPLVCPEKQKQILDLFSY
jgi:hypothetical protein